MPLNLLTILGPTATGKTKLAAKLAYYFNGEIISADSRQVYKGMDIGTGKDLQDYIVNGENVPSHLIDILEPSDEFNLFLFKKYFNNAFTDIHKRNKLPILVGGTGLYISSILQKYKLKETDFSKNNNFEKLSINELRNILIRLTPKLHNTTNILNRERLVKAIKIAEAQGAALLNININPLVIGIRLERNEIKKRITDRLKKRLNSGMIEETELLLNKGLTYDKLNFFGLEYKYTGLYLKKELSFNDMFQKLNSAIHNFAKRQMTWYRKMEREGVFINWIAGADYEKAKELVIKAFNTRL